MGDNKINLVSVERSGNSSSSELEKRFKLRNEEKVKRCSEKHEWVKYKNTLNR